MLDFELFAELVYSTDVQPTRTKANQSLLNLLI
jgi:hypothetical protein